MIDAHHPSAFLTILGLIAGERVAFRTLPLWGVIVVAYGLTIPFATWRIRNVSKRNQNFG